MPGPYNSWLYIRDRSGLAFELINGARTKAYLSNPALQVPGIDACQPFTGLTCATWPYRPYMGPPVAGYLGFSAAPVGNYGLITRTALTAPVVVRQTMRVSVDALGVQSIFAGWNSTHTQLALTSLNRLSFFVRRLDAAVIGVSSGVTIPNLRAKVPFWVDCQVNATTGAMVYRYSLEQISDRERVTWITLDTPTSTNVGTVLVTQSQQVVLGFNSTTGAAPFNGNVYSFTEICDGVVTAYFHNNDLIGVSPSATSFTLTSGHTTTVVRAGLVPMTITPTIAATDAYARFPAVTGNYLSVPDANNLEVAKITLVAKVRPTTWKPTGNRMIMGRAVGGNVFRMILIGPASGAIYLGTYDAAAVETNGSSAAYLTQSGVVDGEWLWFALSKDPDDGAGNRVTRFLWAYDIDGRPGPWTQFAATTTAGATNINQTSPAPLEIGAASGAVTWSGDIGYAALQSGASPATGPAGTDVFRFNADTDLTGINLATATSFPASTGQTVTVFKSGGTPLTLTAASGCAPWVPLTFTTPAADPAPWYNSAYPMSADALGFVVQDWTGLDDGHVTRASTPWGGYGGGSTLSQIAAVGRTMKVNLYLYGRTEEAVEYLFRWLGAALTGVCASCATESMLVRRYCGSPTNLWDGVAEMRGVGLIEGLKWEAEIQPEGNRYVRTASFALMAGDPCMYSADYAVLADSSDLSPANLSACFAASIPNPARAICRPSCSEVKAACRLTRAFTVNPLGAMAPIVTWTNSMSQYSFPFRAVGYSDPGLIGPSNPCGLPVLGELYVRPLPPGGSLRWDVVGRNVQYADETTGGWSSGWAYIEPNDRPKQRFFAVPCGKGYIVMEPASLCATFVSGTTWTLDGITYNPPTYPTVSVSMGERLSCP